MMNLETISELTIKARADGVAEATDALNKFAAAGDNVAVVSDKTSKVQASVASAVDRQQRSLDAAYASQQKYTAAQTTLQRGLDQGLITQGRYNDLLAAAGDKYGAASGGSKIFQTALSGVSGQLIALSAGAGPVGVFLSALGPWGIAAAVALETIRAGMEAVTAGADRMGAKAQQVHDFAETLNVTATQLQGLQGAAASVGISTETIDKSFEKFTLSVEQLRTGTGTLYTDMLRINPVILQQMASTRSAAAEWDLFAKALASADEEQRNTLANTAFGRGGVGTARVAGATLSAGGLNSLQQAPGAISQQQVELWSNLATAMERAKVSAQDVTDKLFSSTILEQQLRSAEALERVAIAASDFKMSPSLQSFFDLMKSAATSPFAALGFQLDATVTEITSARQRLTDSLNKSQNWQPDEKWNTMSGGAPGAPSSMPGAGGKSDSSVFDANAYKATIAALGEAATPAEKFKSTLLDLNKALTDHVLTADQASHANSVLQESFDVAALNRNMAALGAAKTPAEQYTQTIRGLSLQLHDGGITQDYYNRGIGNAADVYRLAITAGRERLGVLTDEELRTNAAKDINKAWADGLIKNSEDAATAQKVLSKSVQDTSDRMKVLASPLPGLTQLGLDAGRLDKQFDSLATGSLNNLGSALGDIESGTVTLSAGMKNLETQFIKSLTNMVFQMTVAKLAAQGLQSVFSAFLPGVNPTPPGSVGVMGLNGNIPTPTYMAEGGNLSAGNWAVVGERGPELIQTLPGGGANVHSNDNSARILSSGLPGYANGGFMPAPAGNGGGNNVQVNVINNASGTSVEHRKSQNGGLDVHDVIISTVNQGIGKGQFDGANRARFGQQVRARPR